MKLYINEIGAEDIPDKIVVSDEYLTTLEQELNTYMAKYDFDFITEIIEEGIKLSIRQGQDELFNEFIPKTIFIGDIDKDKDLVINDYFMTDNYLGNYMNRFNSHTERLLSNKSERLLRKENLNMVRKLHLKESEASNDIMSLIKDIPEKDIDHWETDLYLRKTPETTKVISKLPDVYKKNVTTFIDNIDHVPWYEIPFVFPKDRNRKGIKESADDVETWDVYYWDKEDMEHYNNKVVHMTSNEVKKYVDSLNADMDDYDREHGWWDYELS